MDSSSANTDLREYLRPLWARKYMIALIVLISAIGTYLYYDAKPRVYSATTRLYTQPSPVEQQLFGAETSNNDRDTQDQAALLQSRDVARRVARTLGLS